MHSVLAYKMIFAVKASMATLTECGCHSVCSASYTSSLLSLAAAAAASNMQLLQCSITPNITD